MTMRSAARFEGACVAITGGGSGIGAAIAAAVAAEGANVAILDLDREAAARVAAGLGRTHLAVQCDVSKPEDVLHAFAAVDRAYEHLDVLVCAAGHAPSIATDLQQRALSNIRRVIAGRGRVALRGLVSVDPGEWDRMIRVHLYGAYYCGQAALRRMELQQSGVILNVSSIVGVTGDATMPHYSAAKGGIIALTKSMALDAATVGVRVNAIAPGWVETPMTTSVVSSSYAPLLRTRIAQARFGAPEEVAAVALHLCSSEASYVTGEVVVVSGGL